jgi:hypothetical protein
MKLTALQTCSRIPGFQKMAESFKLALVATFCTLNSTLMRPDGQNYRKIHENIKSSETNPMWFWLSKFIAFILLFFRHKSVYPKARIKENYKKIVKYLKT